MSVNKVILLGRLGQDPELKYTPAGIAVCTFSVATSDVWVDKAGAKQEKTEWSRILIWNKLAETCAQYLKKGRQVYLEGKMQTRTWDDKDGKKMYTTEVVVSNVQFIGDKGDSGTKAPPSPTDNNAPRNGQQQQQSNYTQDANFTTDDIPF